MPYSAALFMFCDSSSGHGTSLGQFPWNQLDASSRLSAVHDLPCRMRPISFSLPSFLLGAAVIFRDSVDAPIPVASR